MCGTDNCRTYHSVRCLNRYIRKFHGNFNRANLNGDKAPADDGYLANEQEESDEKEMIDRVDRVPFDYTSRVARFMLTLREKYNTPESAVEYSVDELSNILQTSPKIVRARAVF